MDLIERQAAIDSLNKMKIYRPFDSDRYVISDCLNKIVDLPSAQPEIIRCRDCKYGKWDSGDRGMYCGRKYFELGTYEDFFCAAAERREVSE